MKAMTDLEMITQLRRALASTQEHVLHLASQLTVLSARREVEREHEIEEHAALRRNYGAALVQLTQRETDLRETTQKLDAMMDWATLQRHVLTTIAAHRDTDRIGEVHVYETDGRTTIPLLEAIAEVAKQEPR